MFKRMFPTSVIRGGLERLPAFVPLEQEKARRDGRAFQHCTFST